MAMSDVPMVIGIRLSNRSADIASRKTALTGGGGG